MVLIVAVDADVLVIWLMDGAPRHEAARRFEKPLSMDTAIGYSRSLGDASEVVRLSPSAAVFHRTLELLSTLKLGRKRILDTALAATLEACAVERLATFNNKDFEIFGFLDVVVPEDVH